MMTGKYLTRYALGLVSLVVAGLVVAGCGDAEYPQLCLLEVTDKAIPDLVDPSQCLAGIEVEDGEAFFILSVLPDDVIASTPLHVTLKTPCTTVELDQEYTLQEQKLEGGTVERSRAFIPVIAPRGSSCSLVVTASVANYRGQRTAHGAAGGCAALAAECIEASAVDGGTDGGP